GGLPAAVPADAGLPLQPRAAAAGAAQPGAGGEGGARPALLHARALGPRAPAAEGSDRGLLGGVDRLALRRPGGAADPPPGGPRQQPEAPRLGARLAVAARPAALPAGPRRPLRARDPGVRRA